VGRCPAIVASDPDPVAPGLSPDDVLTLYFTKATNQPQVGSTSAVLSLLAFSPPLATQLRASWQPGGDSVVPSAGHRLVITLSGTVNGNISATLLPSVRVAVLPSGGLRDASGTSPVATSPGLPVSGTWGNATAPRFADFAPVVALDYGAQPGLGPGDALLLRFDQPVVQVPVGNKTALDRLFTFQPSYWAGDYSGVWLSLSALLVTVRSLGPAVPSTPSLRASTAVGALQVSVVPEGGLTSFDGTSPPSNASSVVTSGSWGEPVCDGGLYVYSSKGLVAAFVAPVNASYAPEWYTIQVESAGVGGAPTAPVVGLAAAPAAGVGLPAPAPANALRYLVQALEQGTPYSARVAPSVPQLPVEVVAVLPRPVPMVFTPLGGDGGCTCTALATGAGCAAAATASATLVATPAVPVIGAWPSRGLSAHGWTRLSVDRRGAGEGLEWLHRPLIPPPFIVPSSPSVSCRSRCSVCPPPLRGVDCGTPLCLEASSRSRCSPPPPFLLLW
jgi:hypothetical protein